MIDKELLEQFQMLAGMIGDVETRLREEMKESETRLHNEIKESETRTKVFIENNVGKRIDSLFDGYKLTHEKQWEMERRIEQLERVVAELQNRIA